MHEHELAMIVADSALRLIKLNLTLIPHTSYIYEIQYSNQSIDNCLVKSVALIIGKQR